METFSSIEKKIKILEQEKIQLEKEYDIELKKLNIQKEIFKEKENELYSKTHYIKSLKNGLVHLFKTKLGYFD